MTLNQFEKLAKDIPDADKFLKPKDFKQLFQSISLFSMADYQTYLDKNFSKEIFLSQSMTFIKEPKYYLD